MIFHNIDLKKWSHLDWEHRLRVHYLIEHHPTEKGIESPRNTWCCVSQIPKLGHFPTPKFLRCSTCFSHTVLVSCTGSGTGICSGELLKYGGFLKWGVPQKTIQLFDEGIFHGIQTIQRAWDKAIYGNPHMSREYVSKWLLRPILAEGLGLWVIDFEVVDSHLRCWQATLRSSNMTSWESMMNEPINEIWMLQCHVWLPEGNSHSPRTLSIPQQGYRYYNSYHNQSTEVWVTARLHFATCSQSRVAANQNHRVHIHVHCVYIDIYVYTSMYIYICVHT